MTSQIKPKKPTGYESVPSQTLAQMLPAAVCAVAIEQRKVAMIRREMKRRARGKQ